MPIPLDTKRRMTPLPLLQYTKSLEQPKTRAKLILPDVHGRQGLTRTLVPNNRLF